MPRVARTRRRNKTAQAISAGLTSTSTVWAINLSISITRAINVKAIKGQGQTYFGSLSPARLSSAAIHAIATTTTTMSARPLGRIEKGLSAAATRMTGNSIIGATCDARPILSRVTITNVKELAVVAAAAWQVREITILFSDLCFFLSTCNGL